VKASPNIIAVLVLSLATWAFFFFKGLPLGAGETTVVVGLNALIVALASWAFRRVRKRPKSEDHAEHS
jgi:drug/metabolite transporter (DMT)-like permease